MRNFTGLLIKYAGSRLLKKASVPVPPLPSKDDPRMVDQRKRNLEGWTDAIHDGGANVARVGLNLAKPFAWVGDKLGNLAGYNPDLRGRLRRARPTYREESLYTNPINEGLVNYATAATGAALTAGAVPAIGGVVPSFSSNTLGQSVLVNGLTQTPVAVGLGRAAAQSGYGKSLSYTRGIDYGRAEPDTDVKHFYDEIVPYIKSHSETAGTPGVDYDASKYKPGFYKQVPMYYGDSSDPNFTSGRAAAYSSQGDGVVLGPTAYGRTPSTQVHELKHQQNNDDFHRSGLRLANPFSRSFWRKGGQLISKTTSYQPGRSMADDGLLTRTYQFTPSVMSKFYGPNSDLHKATLYEQGTTHAEHQFDIMREFREKYGRNPTGPEYVDFIRNADNQTLDRWRGFSPNAYQAVADDTSGATSRMSYRDADEQASNEIKNINFPEWVEINSQTPQEDIDAYKNQDWYKLRPELFDRLLLLPEPGSKSGFDPKFRYMNERIEELRKPVLNYNRETFRRALMNVARNGRGKNTRFTA